MGNPRQRVSPGSGCEDIPGLLIIKESSSMASLFRITFIGTGGSWPQPGRAMPSVMIQVDETVCLFDCGEGSQKQIMKSPTSFMKIDHIFISHFHGDHFLGILGLIQSMSFNGREKELHVYGPPGAISILTRAFNVGYYSLTYNIKIHELQYDSTVSLNGFKVRTMKADHPVPAFSYRIDEDDLVKIDPARASALGIDSRLIERIRDSGQIEVHGRTIRLEDIQGGVRKGRSVVYSGDTRPNPAMVEFASRCSVLIHDTTTDSSLEPKVNEFGHTSSRQAAGIARDAGAGKLFLYHFSPRIDSAETLLNESRSIFPESYLSEDLMVVEIQKGEVLTG
jgi:ribonuclease Z